METYKSPTYLAEAHHDGTVRCPECLKPSRKLTATGKIFEHNDGKGKTCPASGALAIFEPLSDADLVNAARTLGRAVHAKDKDKSGKPYEFHLAGVAQGVEVLAGFHPHALAAAWLHDTIEDHPATVSEAKLTKWGFPKEVVQAVEAVTKRSQEEQGKYLQRVVDAGETAMLTKLADLMHNTRMDRLAELPEATRVRLLKKYTPAKARLMLELGIIQTEEGQKLATKPVGTSPGSSWTSSNADGSSNYSGNSLIKGDWPAGWPAPIKEKITKAGSDTDKVRYLLEDGTAKIAEKNRRYKVWTVTSSKKPPKGKPDDWTPASEKETTEQAKPKKASPSRPTNASNANSTSNRPQPLQNLVSRTPSEADPQASKNAPHSVCGKCGRETYQITSHFWKHVDDLKGDYHTPTSPTTERAKRLLEDGLVAYSENGHTVHVKERLDSTRVAWECTCGKDGECADITKFAPYHCSKD